MHKTFAGILSVTLLAAGFQAMAAPTVYEFVPGRTGRAGMLTVAWDGASTNLPLTVVTQRNKGITNRLDDAALQIGELVTWYVRPRLKPYQSFWEKKTTKDGLAVVARWNEIPGASRHGFLFDFDADSAGNVAVRVDGSYVGTVSRPAHAAGVPRVTVKPTPAGTVSPRTAVHRCSRFETLRLDANPRASAFAKAGLSGIAPGDTVIDSVPLHVVAPRHSQDAGLCRQSQRAWALYIDEYRARSPADGYPSAIHFRLPSGQYLKAHVLVAFDEKNGKSRRFSALQTAYMPEDGTGDNKICTVDVDFGSGVPAGFRKVGEVTLDGKATPLYFGTISFDLGPYVDLASANDYIDFELNGTDLTGSKPSGANFFAVTLEKSPVLFEMAQHTTGNVFTRDEKTKLTGVRLRGWMEGFAGSVVWNVADRTERMSVSVKPGETRDFDIDLSSYRKVGLYDMTISLLDAAGTVLFRHPARFCIAPDAGRLSDKDIVASPYAWWWFDRHGVPVDPDFGGPLLQKAGVHKVGYLPLSPETCKKYNLTSSGNVTAPPWPTWPGPRYDRKLGKFKDKDGETGEEFFVREMKRKIARAGRADRVLIWHENAPANHIPEEILGLPVPPATEKDREAGAYVNECGRLIRKHFPELRIEIGNWLQSLGAATLPLRGGADPRYYDAVAIESGGFRSAPERLNANPMATLLVQEAAAKAAGRPVRVNACWEYTSRSYRLLGEDRHMAWKTRDIIIGLVHGFDLIMSGSPCDVCNGYYSSTWGGGSDCMRAPYAYPKKKYLAMAVLTKCLDAVTFRRLVPTGSTTVYAAEFSRPDGKFVTALWTARGEAEVEADGKGTLVSLLGEESRFGGWFHSSRFTVSGDPCYAVTDDPVKSFRIVSRSFPTEEKLFAAGEVAVPLATAKELVPTNDPGYHCDDIHHLPIYKMSDAFSLSDAVDPVLGPCVEVKLDTSKRPLNRYFTEYAKYDLPEPVPLPRDANWIGMRVKGNSNWGQIRFEVEDAKGKRFRFWLRRTKGEFDKDFYDQAGTTCVNFDGWGYVYFPLGNDKEGCGWGWQRFSGPSGWQQTKPLKLTSVMISMNREQYDLIGFSPAEPRLLIKDIFWSKAPEK